MADVRNAAPGKSSVSLRSSSSSRSSTRFATTRSLLYDFMTMPGLPPSPSPPRLYATSSSRLQSGRWEGVLYSVRFAFPRPFVFGLGNVPRRTGLLSEVCWCTLARWTRRHWNRRLSSLADNPNFGLFGPPLMV